MNKEQMRKRTIWQLEQIRIMVDAACRILSDPTLPRDSPLVIAAMNLVDRLEAIGPLPPIEPARPVKS